MSVVDLLRCADRRPFMTDVGGDGANGPLDPAKVLDLHDLVQGFLLRASKGNWYTDSAFAHNVQVVQDVDRPWCPYHVLYSTHSFASQKQRIFTAAPSPGPWRRRILDVETPGDPRTWADLTWRMSEACLSEDGKRPIIYTRTNLANAWFVPFWTVEQLNLHYWHLAAYLNRTYAIARWAAGRTGEHLGLIAIPTNVQRDRLILHQTGDTAPAFTLYPPPKGSYRQDTDRWLLNPALLANFANL